MSATSAALLDDTTQNSHDLPTSEAATVVDVQPQDLNTARSVPNSQDDNFAAGTPPAPSSVQGSEWLSRSSAPADRNWVSRVHSRTQELCKWFGIPVTETLLDEFHCAMRKRVLLQEIIAVRKKTHLRFPNSIEIEDSSRHKEFFTSFLSREDAFRLIVNCWSQARPCMQGLEDMGDDDVVGDGSGRRAQAGRPLGHRKATSVGYLETPSAGGSGRQEGSPELGYVHAGSTPMFSRQAQFDDADLSEEEDNPVWNVVECSQPVPPLAPDARPLISTILPCSPRDFFDIVLADQSHFFEDFLESQGNRRINIANWKRHEHLGFMRDIQFIAPIKGAFGNWGVSHTQCYQTHRFCQYPNGFLVFETSQTMTDIPYGDCFTVDLRWDVRPDPTVPPEEAQSLVDISLRVPFSRKCLFRKVIESGTFKQATDSHLSFIEALRRVLAEHPKGSMPQLHQAMPPGADPLQPGSAALLSPIGRVSVMGLSPSATAFDQPGQLGTAVCMRTSSQHALSHQPGGTSMLSFAARLLDRSVEAVMGLLLSYKPHQQKWLAGMMIVIFLAQLLMLVSMMHLRRAPVVNACRDDKAFWAQRLQILQKELCFLQQHMESLSRQVGSTLTHLGGLPDGG